MDLKQLLEVIDLKYKNMNKLEYIETLKKFAIKAQNREFLKTKIEKDFIGVSKEQIETLTNKLWEYHYKINGWPYGLYESYPDNLYKWFANNYQALHLNNKSKISIGLRGIGNYIEELYNSDNNLYVLLYYQSNSTDTSRSKLAINILGNSDTFRDKFIDSENAKYCNDYDDVIYYSRVYQEEKEDVLKYIFDTLKELLIKGKLV